MAEHHLTPLARPGQPGSVEVHTGALRGRWRDALVAAELLARAGPAEDGAAGLRLSRTDAALILIAHAQLQDEARVLLEVPLRALHETSLVLSAPAGSADASIDWPLLVERAAGAGARTPVEEHLQLTASLFSVPPPVPVGPEARRHARVVLAVADHDRARGALGQVAFVPRSFSAERMVALHGGPDRGPGLWRTRAGHAAAGLGRRLRSAAGRRRR